ncbi:hypothetical protein [Methanofollis ethanolicus]|uniref:hypothetical protein n=1 Tax=Methanofollis ethanolicus TaxID=488124 RepID=UPI000835A375|nr:hypothetical protein [Methanofollis ethanolicus]
MVHTIDQTLLTRLTIAIIIGIVIVSALIGLRVMGVLEEGSTPTVPGADSDGDSTDIRSTSPTPSPSRTGAKNSDERTLTLNWTYRDRQFVYACTVKNATYNMFRSKNASITSNMTTGDLVAQSVATDGDGGLVDGIAGYILEQSVENGWGDYDTIRNTVACVQQYGPGEFVNTPPDGHYRHPVETLWEGTGDRDDINILAASVLKAMGYPVAFLVFPEQYDRGHLIWEYPAVGIRCDDTIDGRTYTALHHTEIGTVTCYPQSRTCSLPDVSFPEPESGYFTGNTTVGYADGRTVAAGEAAWDIPARTIAYPEGFVPPAGMTPIFYRMENASWVTTESFIYIDALNATALPGEVPGELAKVEPVIVTTLIDAGNNIAISRDDLIDASLTASLRTPSPLKTDAGPELRESLSGRLGIRVPTGMVDEVGRVNRISEDAYWQDVWYDTKVNFYDRTWYLDVMNYEVIENQPLYTKSNEIYISPTEAWRIRYEAVPKNPPDNDIEGLSSFSDMRFAVYKVDEETGSAMLVDEFAYGHTSGQDTVNYHTFYETGTFYIVTFVRNCEAVVSIQMHGKGGLLL